MVWNWIYGRAKRGDGTAKDGRKTERSSAPYAEAYSPRFCEYMFEFGLDKFLQKKKQHHINFHRTIYRAPGRCVRFCICTASDVHQKDLPRKSHRTENSMNGNEQEWKECRKDMKGKKRKQRRGKEKRGSKGVSPCALQTQIFQKKEKKNKRMKRTKKKQRSMFSMHLDFYKISLGHFQTRSKSLSRALLQFEHTNAQHTGIWWLPRPTFCQAAPFVIIPH